MPAVLKAPINKTDRSMARAASLDMMRVGMYHPVHVNDPTQPETVHAADPSRAIARRRPHSLGCVPKIWRAALNCRRSAGDMGTRRID